VYPPAYSLNRQASWDDVILDNKFKGKVQHDYRSFFKSEDVYKNLGVPWKRGLIFLGVSEDARMRTV
jgi:hypothetical protein